MEEQNIKKTRAPRKKPQTLEEPIHLKIEEYEVLSKLKELEAGDIESVEPTPFQKLIQPGSHFVK